jgi:glutamine synthetase
MAIRDPRKSSAGDVLRRIKDEQVVFVDIKFVDLFGMLQHVTLPADQVDESTFHEGLGFDGSSVRGFQEIHESDMLLRPDPGSVFSDPFFDEPTLSVLCDVVDPIGYRPYVRDPRGVAKRAERLVRSLGIAEDVFLGPELEFFVFDEVRFEQATQHGFYFVNSEGAFWNTGRDDARNLGPRPSRKHAYYAVSPADLYNNLRGKMTLALQELGLTVELHHHEVAAAGQNEIGFRFARLTEAADNSIKYKYAVKNVAHRFGKTATFMPKPLFEENGSGMHINLSLFKGGSNVFYEHGRYGNLSRTAELFIGGVLRHAPALCAFCNPTTNSYRRLVPGYEAPINLVYSARNRSACVRLPLAGGNPKRTRIEYRTPDPSANPYLAFASVLMAGIDGIQNEIEPPAPIDEDIYEIVGSERGQSIENTPGSLEKALECLEQDHDFLLRDGVFDQSLIETWIRMKRKHELNYISLRPHPSEFALYYDA